MYLWYNQQQLVHYYVDLESIMNYLFGIFKRYKENNSLKEFFDKNHSLKDLYNLLITDRNEFLKIVKSIDIISGLSEDDKNKDIKDISEYDEHFCNNITHKHKDIFSNYNFGAITLFCLEPNMFWTGIYFMIYRHMVNGLLRAKTDYSKTKGRLENLYTKYYKGNKLLYSNKELNYNMKINRLYNKVLDNYKITYQGDFISSTGNIELNNGKTIKTYYSSLYISEDNTVKYKNELCQNIDNIMKKVLDKTITLRFLINGKAYDAVVEEAKIDPSEYTYLKKPAPIYAYYKHKTPETPYFTFSFIDNNYILIRPVYRVTKLVDMDGVEQPINLKDAYGIYKVYDAPYNVMDMQDLTKNVVKMSEPNIDHRLYKEDILDYTLTDYQTIYDDIFDNKDPNLNMNYYQGRHVTITGDKTYDFVTYNTAPQFLSEETILKNVNTQKLTYKNSTIKMLYDPFLNMERPNTYDKPYMSKLKPFEPISTNVGQYLDHNFSLDMFDLTPFLSDTQIAMINNSLAKLDKLVIPILCKKNPVYRVDYEAIVDDTKEEQDYFLNALQNIKDISEKSDTYNKIGVSLDDLNKKVPYITPNTIRDFDNYMDSLSQIKDNENIRFNPSDMSTHFYYSTLANIINRNKDKHNLHTIGDFKMEDYTDNLFFFDLCAQYAMSNNISKEDDEKDDVITKLLTLLPNKIVPHSMIIINDLLVDSYGVFKFDFMNRQLVENGIDKDYKTALKYYNMWISNGGGGK